MSSNKRNHYKTLQIQPDAAQEVVDAAYRCLSKKYHPDINKNPMAVEHMKEINIAYDIVGDTRKRKMYNFDFFKENNSFKSSGSSYSYTTNTMNTQKYEDKQPVRDPAKELKREEDEAYRVLDSFFSDTVNENWEEAYQKLTRLDTENVPINDFIEWRKAVSKIYKLGEYKISFFRRYLNCEYAGAVYPVILQFAVKLNEMHVYKSKVNEETSQKYVAFDGQSWRVCLGYKDLKQNIHKFRQLAYALPKLDEEGVFMRAIEKIDLLTGIFSLNGFTEQAEREILRSKRYGNRLSMGVIKVELKEDENINEDEEGLAAYISFLAEKLSEGIRRTDILGRSGEASLVLLFTETKPSEAKRALNKLLAICDSEEYANYNIYFACVEVTGENVKNSIQEALNSCILREVENVESFDEEEDEEKAKLGKYKIGDILKFNKKGRNHF